MVTSSQILSAQPDGSDATTLAQQRATAGSAEQTHASDDGEQGSGGPGRWGLHAAADFNLPGSESQDGNSQDGNSQRSTSQQAQRTPSAEPAPASQQQQPQNTGPTVIQRNGIPVMTAPYRAGNNHSLDGWIAQALGRMGMSQQLVPAIRNMIMHESGGDPDIVNGWDINAVNGTPSIGLMQNIQPSYELYVLPSLADRPITDPVANITAGVRNMLTNHGIEPLMNGGRTDSSGDYIGYGGGAPLVDYLVEHDRRYGGGQLPEL